MRLMYRMATGIGEASRVDDQARLDGAALVLLSPASERRQQHVNAIRSGGGDEHVAGDGELVGDGELAAARPGGDAAGLALDLFEFARVDALGVVRGAGPAAPLHFGSASVTINSTLTRREALP